MLRVWRPHALRRLGKTRHGTSAAVGSPDRERMSRAERDAAPIGGPRRSRDGAVAVDRNLLALRAAGRWSAEHGAAREEEHSAAVGRPAGRLLSDRTVVAHANRPSPGDLSHVD